MRIAILFAAGIGVGSAAELPPSTWAASCGVLFCGLTLLMIRRSTRSRGGPLRTVAAAGLVFCLGALTIGATPDPWRAGPEVSCSRTVTLFGSVLDAPAEQRGHLRFTMHATRCREGGREYPLDISVVVRAVRTAADSAPCVPVYGMRLAVTGSLSAPPAERNPGEFSLRQYYNANGIAGVVFLRGWSNIGIRDSCGGSWYMRDIVMPCRSAIIRMVDATIGGEEGELLKGLLIGDRSGISSALKEAFAASGVAHVLAVSGSNVAVVAGIFLFLIDLFRIPRCLRGPVTAVGLLFYAALTGNQPPVVRATLMAIILLAGRLVQRRAKAGNALGVSALLMLAVDARQLFDVGFQLSFTAVLSIILLYPLANNHWLSKIPTKGLAGRSLLWTLRICAVSLVATLGTFPLCAYYFSRVSLVGILANIMVIPATSLSVVIGASAIVLNGVGTWLAMLLGEANRMILRWTMLTAITAARLPWAALDVLSNPVLSAIPYYLAVGLLFQWHNPSLRRALGLALLGGLTLVVWLPPRSSPSSPPNCLQLSMIDVGQGDAILLEFPHGETMVVDAGPASPFFDAGEKVVAPFLKRRGISRIDYLVISHPDADHAGGVPALLRQFEVVRMIEGAPLALPCRPAAARSASAEQVTASTGVTLGTVIDGPPGTRLYVLWPAEPSVASGNISPKSSLNSRSVVIRLVFGEISFLFTGDAPADAEEMMITRFGSFLQSTVLKVSHHGSATSSSRSFLETVRPSFALFSVGAHNRFGHPSREVVQAFHEIHAEVARTDEEGAVMLATDGHTLWRVPWR